MATDKKYSIYIDDVNISFDIYAFMESNLSTREIIDGTVTAEQFENIFGGEANMVEHMCLETSDADGFDIRVFLSDVIACEHRISHHSILINCYRESVGLLPLTTEEMILRAKGYDELSPEAAFFLMYLTNWGLNASEIDDMDEALALMGREGLTIDHFLKDVSQYG